MEFGLYWLVLVVDKYKGMQEKRVEFALANSCVFVLESLKEKPCG